MKNHTAPEAFAAPMGADLKRLYQESFGLVERLHRLLLDVIKDEFDRSGREDIKSVNALLLFHIGDATIPVGAMRARNYYLGTNVAYSLKKLVEGGFINREQVAGRRIVRISLTEKGRDVARMVEGLYDRHVRTIAQVGGLSAGDLDALRRSLMRLEQTLNAQSFGPRFAESEQIAAGGPYAMEVHADAR